MTLKGKTHCQRTLTDELLQTTHTASTSVHSTEPSTNNAPTSKSKVEHGIPFQFHSYPTVWEPHNKYSTTHDFRILQKKTRLICLPNATNVLSQQATVGCMVDWRQTHTTGRGVTQRLLGHLPSPSCCASELVQYKHFVRLVSKPFVSRASLGLLTDIGMHFHPEHAEATATTRITEYHFSSHSTTTVRKGTCKR